MKKTMEGYIKSQPTILRNIINDSEAIIGNVHEEFNDEIKYVYILGSGTSYHASQYAEWLFANELGYVSKAMVPTLFNNYELDFIDKHVNKHELMVIAISQSGTSTSTISALRSLKTMGIKTMLLTEDLESPAVKHTDLIVPIKCGKEEIPPETMGYTATLVTLYLLSLKVMLYRKNISDDEYADKLSQLNKLPSVVDGVIEKSYAYFNNNLELFKDFKKAAFIGYGLQFITTQEATLKLFETNHQPINFYELEESIHGPQMAVNDESFIFIFGSDGVELAGLQRYINYFETLTNNVFLISDKKQLTSKQPVLLIDGALSYLLSVFNFTVTVQVISDVVSKANGKDTSVHPLGDNRGFSHAG